MNATSSQTATKPATFTLTGVDMMLAMTATFTVRGESVEIATAWDFRPKAPHSRKTLSREAARQEWSKLVSRGWKVAK